MSVIMSVTYYAEPINYNDVKSDQEDGIEQGSVNPRAILPVGIYYCESNRFAYIQIDSTTSATTTCTVYNVYYPNEKKYICGTGGYVYNLNSNFNVEINTWFEYGTQNVRYDSAYFDAVYSGGKIILGGETYAMD